MEKLKMESPDLTQENIKKIAALFPNVVTEIRGEDGKVRKGINFDLLKQELSPDVVEGEECYDFTWVGKKAAMVEGNTPIRKTLRPCLEESKDWEKTGNLYIEGDNLDVLKLLQESYLNSVKMIYIDPPYNTGNDGFVYPDDFKMDKDEYEEQIEFRDAEGSINFRQNNLTNPLFHSDWCSMIYPCLKLAQKLLSEDGFIFISMGDSEIENLKKICDEIFGEANFVSMITRITKKGGNKGFFIKPKKDHILFYANSLTDLNHGNFGLPVKIDRELGGWQEEIHCGEKRLFKRGDIPYRANLDVRPNQRYYIQAPDGSLLIPPGDVFPKINRDGEMVKPNTNNDKCWTWSRNRYLKEKAKGRFMFIRSKRSPFLDQNRKQAEWTVYKKVFITDLKKRRDILTDYIDTFENSLGTKELAKLKIPYSYPKPSLLIQHLLRYTTSKNDLVLDFFAGSSTTAHAVMQLNAEDGGNRKFIMVQLAEPTNENSEAFKAGYKTVSDIGKERIRRAGEKIKAENKDKEGIDNLDTGFRVFKVDSTNMKDVYYAASEYDQQMLAGLESNIKDDRTDLDLLYGVLLNWNLPLSLPHTIEEIEGIAVHTVDEGSLMACFAENVPETVVRKIASRQPLRVVFRDSSFANSPDKINVTEIFKLMAPNTTVKVI